MGTTVLVEDCIHERQTAPADKSETYPEANGRLLDEAEARRG